MALITLRNSNGRGSFPIKSGRVLIKSVGNFVKNQPSPVSVTKGNGSTLYGLFPKWTASNWRVSLDVVFPVIPLATANFIFDSAPDGLNRFVLFTQTTTNTITVAGATSIIMTLDGSVITSGATVHPTDGLVHRIVIASVSPYAASLGTLLRRYSAGPTQYGTVAVSNLELSDLTNTENSRIYPLNEGISTNTFEDVSVNAQNGTWYNRTSSDVIQVLS